MTEYAGYIPIKPIDWTSKASEATNKFLDVYYDREKQKRDLDALQDDAISEVSKFDTSNSQTFNNFILNGSQSAKSYIQAQNDLLKKGVIDQNTYKRNIQNSREGFSSLKILTDSVNERIKIGTERVNSGKASPMEQFIQDNLFNILDVSNKQFIQDNNGNGYIVSTDGKTKVSTKSLNNSLNQFIDTPDIIADVNKAVEGLGVGARNEGGRYVISQTLVGDWEGKTKPQMAKNILSSPQKAANVLAINKGYTFTSDPKEAQSGGKILMVLDPNGAYVPKLTEAQNKEALSVVEDTISSRVDFKEKDIDPNEGKKLENEAQRIAVARQQLALEYKKLDIKEQKENEPYYYRLQTINDILSGSKAGMAAIIGKPLTYASARGLEGEKSGDIAKAYAGYVVNDVIPLKNGDYKVTMKRLKKTGDTTKEEVKSFTYDKRGLVADVTQVLDSGLPANGKLNVDKVLSLYDRLNGGAANATTGGSSSSAGYNWGAAK